MGQILSFLPIAKSQTNGNFNIISCISEEVLPSTAKDGDIAIISSVPFENTYIQDFEPTAQKNGDLWIYFAVDGTLPAIGGSVIIYPQKAYQHINGVWTIVAMKVHKDGTWLDATGDVVIYVPGDEAEEITDGWYASSAATLTKETNRMVIYNGFVSTVSKIDLTHYSRLTFEVCCTSGANSYVGIGTVPTEFVASASTSLNETVYFTRVIDLEAMTGEYYILIKSNSGSSPTYVTKIELIA